MENKYLEDVSVLIVDDQEFIRLLVREMLRVLGCTKILDAADSEAAWELLQHEPVDLTIVDWYMKPMTESR